MCRIVAYLMLATALMPAGAQFRPSTDPRPAGIEAYENPLYRRWLSGYDIKYYHLVLEVTNESTRIEGSATILVESALELDTLVLELQDSLEVTRVEVTDMDSMPVFNYRAGFEHRDNAIFVALDRARQPGEKFAVRIFYGGKAGRDRGFFAGITTATDFSYGFRVTYTLSEPLNAKDWFPVKQVLGDKIDSVRMDLLCEDRLMAASNGILMSVEEYPDNRHLFRWKTVYPMAYYLLFFTVADYRDFSFQAPLSEEGDSVLVQNYIYDSDQLLADWEEKILETARLIQTFSMLLDDYPFSGEKYGHAMAPLGGGMEHQTMTTIQDFDFFLVAHELAHQWFGDYVTCGNWQDIWINEGFASYMEYVSAQQLLGQGAADEWMSHAMSIALNRTSGSVYVPEERGDDPSRLFDNGLSYKKGAILLHMIRYILDDDDLFFRVLRTYLARFGNGLATGEDFKRVLERESGIDFSSFFQQWYYGEGYPGYRVYWYQERDTLYIRSEQTGTSPATPLFTMPFDVDVAFSDGSVERMRFMQDDPVEAYSVTVDGTVRNLVFDPDTDLLKSVSVIRQVPPDRVFVFGPNPVDDELRVELVSGVLFRDIVITSLSGREVFRRSDVPSPALIDLTELADGPYLLVVDYENRKYTERIVKISGN